MDCKSMYTGSIPVGTSIATLRCFRALSSAGERFLDVEEVTGSIPVAPTSKTPVSTGVFWRHGLIGTTSATPIGRELDTLAPDRSVSRRSAAASSRPSKRCP